MGDIGFGCCATRGWLTGCAFWSRLSIRGVVVLVELGLVEQRHAAVLEVLDGVPVVEVAERFGVSRQTVHRWLRALWGSGVGDHA